MAVLNIVGNGSLPLWLVSYESFEEQRWRVVVAVIGHFVQLDVIERHCVSDLVPEE